MVGGVEFPDNFLTEVKMNPSFGTGRTPVHCAHTHAVMRTLGDTHQTQANK